MLQCFLVLIVMLFSLTVVDADDFPGPFGLIWGMSEGDLKKLGFTKTEEFGLTGFDAGYGFNVFVSKSPPKLWSKGDDYYAVTHNNQLVKVTAISAVITDDIDGDKGKEIYSEIKELFTKKYGTPSRYEIINTDLCGDANEFYQYLSAGCGAYFSAFKFSGVRMGITLMGIRHGTGYLHITYETQAKIGDSTPTGC